MHCGKLANKRKANARESVERKKRVRGREKSGLQARRAVYPYYSFPTLFPDITPSRAFSSIYPRGALRTQSPTMFYLAGTYIFRPAEIRRLSGRKCLERTSESGMRKRENRKRESETVAKREKGKRLQEEMRPKS